MIGKAFGTDLPTLQTIRYLDLPTCLPSLAFLNGMVTGQLTIIIFYAQLIQINIKNKAFCGICTLSYHLLYTLIMFIKDIIWTVGIRGVQNISASILKKVQVE